MREYTQVLEDLKAVVNQGRSRKNQHIEEEFKAILKELYNGFNKEISTKFLRALIYSKKSNIQKSQRVKYLIMKSGLKTKRRNRYFKGWMLQKWKTDLIEYAHREDGLIYYGNLSYTEEEAQQEAQIKEVALKNGIELYNRAEEDFNRRQNLREAINRGGGVFIKDIKPQTIGKLTKPQQKEVLFFVTGF